MTVRCFAAVEIADHQTVAALGRAQQELRQTGVDARWVRPEQFHLTLKFLGEIPDQRVAGALSALRRAAGAFPCWQLEFRGLGVFPSPERPRVLWCGLGAGRRSLEELAAAVEKEMEMEGFAREQRRFSPHLTLGRIREGARIPPGLPALLNQTHDLPFGSVTLTAAVLMKSELGPAGPAYTPLGKTTFSPG